MNRQYVIIAGISGLIQRDIHGSLLHLTCVFNFTYDERNSGEPELLSSLYMIAEK
jgi:hypothetical protein